jgi:hypothetical protein
VIIIFTLFIPSSPRWLLSKDRDDEAIAALRRLRPDSAGPNDQCAAEILAIKTALREQVHKAPWLDLVRGTNLRRTALVMVYYFFQQVSPATSPLPWVDVDLILAVDHWPSLRLHLSDKVLQDERIRGSRFHISYHQQLSQLFLCHPRHVLGGQGWVSAKMPFYPGLK